MYFYWGSGLFPRNQRVLQLFQQLQYASTAVPGFLGEPKSPWAILSVNTSFYWSSGTLWGSKKFQKSVMMHFYSGSRLSWGTKDLQNYSDSYDMFLLGFLEEPKIPEQFRQFQTCFHWVSGLSWGTKEFLNYSWRKQMCLIKFSNFLRN